MFDRCSLVPAINRKTVLAETEIILMKRANARSEDVKW